MWNGIKLALGMMVYGICSYISNNCGYCNHSERDRHYSHSNATYSDAVNAIVNSDMFDAYKQEAISYVKKNQRADYYDGVIHIANSTMFDHYKSDAIRDLK